MVYMNQRLCFLLILTSTWPKSWECFLHSFGKYTHIVQVLLFLQTQSNSGAVSCQTVAWCAVVHPSPWLPAGTLQQWGPGWLGAGPSHVESKCGKYRNSNHHHNLTSTAARSDRKHCYQWQHCWTGKMHTHLQNESVCTVGLDILLISDTSLQFQKVHLCSKV